MKYGLYYNGLGYYKIVFEKVTSYWNVDIGMCIKDIRLNTVLNTDDELFYTKYNLIEEFSTIEECKNIFPEEFI